MKPRGSAKINNQPLYLQAIEALQSLIEQGVYPPGAMLPPEDTLAGQLGVSRLTLREALGYLEGDGIIERKRGVGTFVQKPSGTHFAGGLERLEPLSSLAKVAGLKVDTVAREVSLVQATAEWASKLAVAEGSELVRCGATQAINGCKVGYFESLSPTSLIDLEDLRNHTGSLLEYLVDRGLHLPSRTHSQVYSINADQRISQLLSVAEGVAVLHLLEVYYLANDQPIVLAYNYFLTNCFNFYISRRITNRQIRR
jgi:GntR family transcriptional regulator